MWWLEETVPSFKGFNISTLNTDEAWLNISSNVEQPLWMYSLSDDCHTCSFQKFLGEPILQNHSYKAVVNTQHGVRFRLRTSGEFNYTPSINDSLDVCDLQTILGEFGVYSILIYKNDPKGPVQCSITNELDPVNTFLPIVVTFLFWILFGLILANLWKHAGFATRCFKYIWIKLLSFFTSASNSNQHEEESSLTTGDEGNREPEDGSNESIVGTSAQRKAYKRRKRSVPHTVKNEQAENKKDANDEPVKPSTSSESAMVNPSSPVLTASQPKRLISLDAFRGLCILIMIFADDRGGGYYFFQHSTWNGLYVADLAFPWFIWICGTSIPFTLHSRLSKGTSKLKIFEEVVVRSFKLILLGIMVNTSTRATAVQLENLRIPGVLQRFGVCYLIGSTLLLIFYHSERLIFQNQHVSDQSSVSWKYYIRGCKTLLPWCAVVICVGLHTAIVLLLPVPDCPRGYLGPAGLHNDSAFPPHCVGGAAGYVDRLIFGMKHIHNNPTSKRVYGSGAFDPEGALGILTSVFHIWLGIQAGITILTYTHVKPRVIRLLFWSIITGVGGFILCGGVSNSGWIPVNKNLWSLSFVLVTSSLAFAILLILYLLIDVQQRWSGSPLIETGRNSILLYLGHEVCHAMVPWHFSYGKMVSHTSKLMETCWGTMLWMLIAVYLHDRQLFFVV